MPTLEVYSFEDSEGQDVTSFTTQDPVEARSYAQQNALRMIANRYEFTDSELVADYTK